MCIEMVWKCTAGLNEKYPQILTKGIRWYKKVLWTCTKLFERHQMSLTVYRKCWGKYTKISGNIQQESCREEGTYCRQSLENPRKHLESLYKTCTNPIQTYVKLTWRHIETYIKTYGINIWKTYIYIYIYTCYKKLYKTCI